MPGLTRRELLSAAALTLPAGMAVARQPGAQPARPTRRDTTPAAQVTPLAFWGGWTGPDGLAMQRLVAAFNAEVRDVQVTLTLYNWDLIFDRWRSEFEAGSPPDLVGFHATEVAEYAARGMLYDVSGEAARYRLHAADFFAPPWRLCQVAGGLYAIPLDVHPLGLYINARAARRAGLDPRHPPRTARELLAWAGRLTNRAGDRWGYAAPAGDVECFRQWYSLLYQFGGRFLDASGSRCQAGSAAGISGYAFLRDLLATWRVAMPQEGSVDADFIAGKVLMYLQGPWYIKGIQQAGLPFVTAPAPRIGARPLVWANSHVLGVVNTLDRSRVAAAMRFIAWLTDHALDWAEAGQIPAHNPARARLSTTAIWPYLRPFAAQLPQIVYQPNSIAQSALFAENLPTPVITATQAVMLGQETPAQAARVMSAQVDSIIASARSA